MKCHCVKFAGSLFLILGVALPLWGQAEDPILGGAADEPPAAEDDQGEGGPDLGDFPGFGFGDEQQPGTEQEQSQLQEQVDKLNASAKAKSQAGDIEGALATYDEALSILGNFTSYFEQGLLLREEEFHQDAIQAFLLALGYRVEADPAQVVKTHVELGKSYVDIEQFNTAIEVFQQGLQPDLVPAGNLGDAVAHHDPFNRDT